MADPTSINTFLQSIHTHADCSLRSATQKVITGAPKRPPRISGARLASFPHAARLRLQLTIESHLHIMKETKLDADQGP